MLATVIDFKALEQVIAAAFAAGIGITAVFGVALYGATRFMDFRRAGRPAIAGVFGAMSIACLVVVVGAVALGIVVMTQKD